MPTFRKSSGPSHAKHQTWRLDEDAPEVRQVRTSTPFMNSLEPMSTFANHTASLPRSRDDPSVPRQLSELPQPQTPSRLYVPPHGSPNSFETRGTTPDFPSRIESDETKTEEPSPWSSAIGRATLGKSGRVIERLMAENDRLRREIRSEMLRREEIQKREEMSRPLADALRAERDNLLQMRATDSILLGRRDRKIEEMRASLEFEKARRLEAEAKAKDASQRCDVEITARRKEVGEAREVAKHATSHSEVLEQSHKQLGLEYRRRVETLTKDIRQINGEREFDLRKFKRLEVVVDQLRHETERANRVNAKMGETFQAYKEESDGRMHSLQQDVGAKEQATDAIRDEMERVVGEARWLINVQKNFKPAG